MPYQSTISQRCILTYNPKYCGVQKDEKKLHASCERPQGKTTKYAFHTAVHRVTPQNVNSEWKTLVAEQFQLAQIPANSIYCVSNTHKFAHLI